MRALALLLLFVTACQTHSVIEKKGGGVRVQYRCDPQDAEVICAGAYDRCLARGVAEPDCLEDYVACNDRPEPVEQPDTLCVDQYYTCASNTTDYATCNEEYNVCCQALLGTSTFIANCPS